MPAPASSMTLFGLGVRGRATLGEDGQSDKAAPPDRAVPLPVQFGGQEQGSLQFPIEGTLVELGFAFGRADRPFIRTVLGKGWPRRTSPRASSCSSNGPRCSSRKRQRGQPSRHTDRRLHDRARCRCTTRVTDYLGEHGQHRLQVAQHSTEEVGGLKLIEALGAVELLAGDDLTLGSLGNMSQTTAGDLVEVVGQLRRAAAGRAATPGGASFVDGDRGREHLPAAAAVDERGGAAGRRHCQPHPRQRASPW